MDKEILDILKSMQEDIRAIKNTQKGHSAEIRELKDEIRELNNKTDKNTIMLEKLNDKVKILAEVQVSFKEQLDRTKDKNGKSLDERLDIIELAVSDTSGRVKDIQKDIARVVRATAENWAEIVELKAVK